VSMRGGRRRCVAPPQPQAARTAATTPFDDGLWYLQVLNESKAFTTGISNWGTELECQAQHAHCALTPFSTGNHFPGSGVHPRQSLRESNRETPRKWSPYCLTPRISGRLGVRKVDREGRGRQLGVAHIFYRHALPASVSRIASSICSCCRGGVAEMTVRCLLGCHCHPRSERDAQENQNHRRRLGVGHPGTSLEGREPACRGTAQQNQAFCCDASSRAAGKYCSGRCSHQHTGTASDSEPFVARRRLRVDVRIRRRAFRALTRISHVHLVHVAFTSLQEWCIRTTLNAPQCAGESQYVLGASESCNRRALTCSTNTESWYALVLRRRSHDGREGRLCCVQSVFIPRPVRTSTIYLTQIVRVPFDSESRSLRHS
jgi:hypothetical protein